MEVYMESVKAFKFMNGWVVKHKDIDKIEEAIWVDRTTALERLYVYGWAVKVELLGSMKQYFGLIQQIC